jgi:hypothetical protein
MLFECHHNRSGHAEVSRTATARQKSWRGASIKAQRHICRSALRAKAKRLRRSPGHANAGRLSGLLSHGKGGFRKLEPGSRGKFCLHVLDGDQGEIGNFFVRSNELRHLERGQGLAVEVEEGLVLPDFAVARPPTRPDDGYPIGLLGPKLLSRDSPLSSVQA